MIIKTKPALLLLALPLGATLSAQNAGPTAAPTTQSAPGRQVTPGSILAAQIQAIVDTKDLSDESKQRQIAAAIRLAIVTGLTNVDDPTAAAHLVIELTRAATQAAPAYAELIFSTVSTSARDIPLLAGMAGLTEAVRDVVAETVRTAAIAAGASAPEAAGAETEGATTPSAPEYTGHVDDVIVSPSA